MRFASSTVPSRYQSPMFNEDNITLKQHEIYGTFGFLTNNFHADLNTKLSTSEILESFYRQVAVAQSV
jgi:hypothetical protein